jgi:predicted permease
MDNVFATFLNSLTSLVICMLVGYFGRVLKVFDDKLISGLTTLLVKITLPSTIFVSLLRPFTWELMAESAATFVLSAGVYLFGGLLALGLAYLFKAKDGEKRVWQFALIFANVGYMGFPVCYAVFGEEGLMYTSMANAAFNVLLFTVGVKLFNAPKEKGGAWRGIVFNPALFATFAGMLLFVTQLRPPQPVTDGISLLGGMTSPISMILVGSILAKGRLRDLLTDWRVVPLMSVRLAVIPLTAFFTLRLFIHNPVMLGVIVVLSAMPVAAITSIFAEKYNGDTVLASKLVVLSTLLCVVSVPLISLLLN